MVRKNKIDLLESMQLFKAYGMRPRTMNFYQIRLLHEDSRNQWDWYFTTGSLVRNCKGNHTSMGKIFDPEDVAIFIRKKENA